MKKPVKIIFSVVLSVAMVLSLALTAYGASSLTSDFAVTVEKGKVFDENGDLYTGWYIKNRHKYYAENGRRARGWKKIGKHSRNSRSNSFFFFFFRKKLRIWQSSRL